LVDKVGRAVREFTDGLHKSRERAGILTDYNPEHVLSVIHDPEKMVNPTKENVERYGETAWDDYQAMSYLDKSKTQRKTWRNFMIEHSDLDKSFPDNYMPNRTAANETYDIAYNNIISEDVIRSKSGRAVGYQAKLEGGKRQIIAKNGESFMAMRQYGEADLFANIKQMSYTAATQIGMVTAFGPRPAEGLEFLIKKYKELHGVSPEVTAAVGRLRSDFNYFANTSAIKADARTELFVHMGKALPQINILGSLAIKSMGDAKNLYSMVKMMGLPQAGKIALEPIINYFSNYAKTLEFKELRREFQIIDESLTSAYNEVMTRNLLQAGDPTAYTSKLTNTMSDYGGIGMWDMYLKLAMTKAWSIELGEATALEWQSLKPYTRMIMEQGGIQERAWNVLRNDPNITKVIQGRKMLVPFESHMISDKLASEAFGVPIGHRVSLQRAKNTFAIQLNSVIKEQSEAVVPTFNPMRDKEFAAEKAAIIENHHEKVFGVNMKYVFFQMMNQFKTWSVNYFDVAMKRMWQAPGTQAAKIARVSEMVIGGAMTNLALDHFLKTITNQDDSRNHSLISTAVHSALSNFGGRMGVYLTALSTAFEGHGQGMNRAVALSSLAKIANQVFHVASPRRDQSHLSELGNLVGDAANVTIPSAIIFGILKSIMGD